MSRASFDSLGGGIQLEELVALNDEMAALVRLGIPLEQGLTELGQDMPGRLGKIATDLGEQMQHGRSLQEVLASDSKSYPPVWRAVVEAGLRSGHLSAALEGMARTGRSMVQLRRSTLVALIYPLIILALAYAISLVVLTLFIPNMHWVAEQLTDSADPLLSRLNTVAQSVRFWFWAPPVAVFAVLLFWWIRSGRAMWSAGNPNSDSQSGSSIGRWWTLRQSRRNGRAAAFAELLAMLLKHGVPMPEAVVLAADASGDRHLSRMSRDIADRLNKGETLKSREQLLQPLPPLLAWSIANGIDDPRLNQTLAKWAETYRQQADRHVEWVVTYLPIFLSAIIGGLAVLTLALLVFGPIIRLLYHLGLPS